MGVMFTNLAFTNWGPNLVWKLNCQAIAVDGNLLDIVLPKATQPVGPPEVVTWFINPRNTIAISNRNHSYSCWSYKPTELSRGPLQLIIKAPHRVGYAP